MLRSCCAVFALAFLSVSPALAQSTPSNPLDEAAALARAGDWPRAEAAYEAILRADATDARAWFGLGAARQEQGRHGEALEALGKAEELRFPNRALLLPRKARAQARLGETDAAFATLETLMQTGFANAELLESHPDLAPLRDDPRFPDALARARRNLMACAARPEFRQFDFWVGEWDVFPAGVGERVGRSRIELILNRCVVQENWTGGGGYVGKSYNIFDPATSRWEQFWVDGVGGRIHFTGEGRDGNLYYTAETVQPDGSKLLRRLTFFRLGQDHVRQFSERSTDGGATWSVEYDFHYYRRK